MKLLTETKKERPGASVKLGIVRLGRAAGKIKYALLDECDIHLIEKYAFEARLEIDKNGRGAKIYAIAYDVTKGNRSHGQYLQTLLWEKHNGGIAPGFTVTHKNGITVDCRLSNLAITATTPTESSSSPLKRRWREGSCVPSVFRIDNDNNGMLYDLLTQDRQEEKETEVQQDAALYWTAIQQIPAEPTDENAEFRGTVHFYTYNGERLHEENDHYRYYECRHPPCCAIEQEPREFSICGRCQEARYCGISCQQRDWPAHKKFCKERRRPLPTLERPPER